MVYAGTALSPRLSLHYRDPVTAAVARAALAMRLRRRDDGPRRARSMHPDTKKYTTALAAGDRAICDLLAKQIDLGLPDAENKIWHAHPVWFLDGNPIVGFSKLKNCVRLLFWSGQSFVEGGLAKEGSFQAAEARYTAVDQVDTKQLGRWLRDAREIQWDYKNLVRRKGKLERLTPKPS